MANAGWDLGVATMKKGEVSKLTITADYGYGTSGSPPTIPGGATLASAWVCFGWLHALGLGGWGLVAHQQRAVAAPACLPPRPSCARPPAPRRAPRGCCAHSLLTPGCDLYAISETLSSLCCPQIFEVELIDWKSVKDIAGALRALGACCVRCTLRWACCATALGVLWLARCRLDPPGSARAGAVAAAGACHCLDGTSRRPLSQWLPSAALRAQMCARATGSCSPHPLLTRPALPLLLQAMAA